MTAVVRTWLPLPAWWIPVWITLEDSAASMDALETAVAELVRAGFEETDAIARQLCLDIALVESAVAALTSSGLLTNDTGRLAAQPAPEPTRGQRARAGFLAWDPASQRPLPQIWLDRELPPRETPTPSGWTVAAWSEPDPYPRRPAASALDEFLRILPSIGGVRLYETVGAGVRESDSPHVRRLRRRSGPAKRAPIWAPVEHRVAGAVVWRPSLVPLPEVCTELDARGIEGIERVAEGAARDALIEAEGRRRDHIAPGVLRDAGFATVGELRSSAAADAARELQGTIELRDWADLVALVEDAIIDEHVARAVGGDWRRPLRAWGDVLERLTHKVVGRLRPVVERVDARALEPDQQRGLRTVLGKSTSRVLKVACQKDEVEKLRSLLRADADSIGTRVLALGVCIALDRATRRAFETLNDRAPNLFDVLDRAKEERNSVVHPKEGTDDIGVAGHRARVIHLCRLLPRLDLA